MRSTRTRSGPALVCPQLLHMARILRETPILPIGNTIEEMGGDAVHTG